VLALWLGPLMAAEAKSPQFAGAIVVADVDALRAALVVENAGRRVVLLRGDYEVDAPLVVPDRVTLQGEGVMLGGTHPVGFEPGTETRIVAAPTHLGDVLRLGNGATVRGLVVEHVVPTVIGPAQLNGIVVSSRGVGDAVSADVIECEIINPNPAGVGPQGPSGRGLVVMVQNPNFGADPPPHEDAEVALRVHRSIVRSTGGGSALIAVSFAARGQITVDLTQNLMHNGIQVGGGVSRPDQVTGVVTTISSAGNLYRAPAATGVGLQLYGASGAPIPGVVTPAANANHTRFSSRNDRIEGFQTAVLAAASRRFITTGENSDNRLDLRLRGLSVETPESGADFVMHGAESSAFPGGHTEFSPGNRNVLRVLVRDSSGSGPRNNRYGHTSGPDLAENQGSGNQVVFIGNAEAFDQTNEGIEPAPEAEFFGN
jgi:hypothetical protein